MIRSVGGGPTPVPFTQVAIEDDFWGPRLATLRRVTIEAVYDRLVETGRIDNFRVAAGGDGEFSGRFYEDSDVYKWLEGACYLLASGDDRSGAEPTLRERVESVVDAVAAAQEPDGYLDTYFQIEDPEGRWTNLGQMHELYCAGHLFEAAVAHRRATGSDRLLVVARRLADHVDDVFGPAGRDGVPGHAEIELALVRLARETGVRRYLDLASFFVERRGHTDRLAWEAAHPDAIGGEANGHLRDADGAYDGTYLQDHAPIRDQERVEGHAVRATYLYAGATDVAVETGDGELLAAVERLWEKLRRKRMYVTGGIGSAREGERFTEDYDLPNAAAYAETCAALGSVRWSHRLLAATGAGRYADLVERTLYNAFLAGYGLDGEHFFYANPHQVDAADAEAPPARREWFGTACCPTNVPRLLGSLGGYLYLRGEEGDVYVAQYVGSDVEVTENVSLRQTTAYPWEGTVEIEVRVGEPAAFGLNLRIPAWCRSFAVSVDGEAVDPPAAAGFARVAREWTGGETVVVEFEMPVDRVAAHPAVAENLGRVALRRGPLVYCLEGVDHDRPLARYALADAPPDATFEPDLLDGVVTLTGTALRPTEAGWSEALYRPADETERERATYTAVPYYAWGHRDPGEMRIWLRADAADRG